MQAESRTQIARAPTKRQLVLGGAGGAPAASTRLTTRLTPPRRGVLPVGGTDQASVSVALAYDGALARNALRLLLDDEGELTVVAEATDLEGALRYVAGRRPRVLVLDLALGRPDYSAIAAIVQMRTEFPKTEIVVIGHHQSLRVREAIAAGAIGCVSTTSPSDHLTEAVRRAGSGEAYISAEILAAIVKRPDGTPDGLSAREVEVIGLLALGYTNAEIGELLFVSVRTVESHRASLQLKLGRPTRSALVTYALEHGMTEGQAVVRAVNSRSRSPSA